MIQKKNLFQKKSVRLPSYSELNDLIACGSSADALLLRFDSFQRILIWCWRESNLTEKLYNECVCNMSATMKHLLTQVIKNECKEGSWEVISQRFGVQTSLLERISTIASNMFRSKTWVSRRLDSVKEVLNSADFLTKVYRSELNENYSDTVVNFDEIKQNYNKLGKQFSSSIFKGISNCKSRSLLWVIHLIHRGVLTDVDFVHYVNNYDQMFKSYSTFVDLHLTDIQKQIIEDMVGFNTDPLTYKQAATKYSIGSTTVRRYFMKAYDIILDWGNKYDRK